MAINYAQGINAWALPLFAGMNGNNAVDSGLVVYVCVCTGCNKWKSITLKGFHPFLVKGFSPIFPLFSLSIPNWTSSYSMLSSAVEYGDYNSQKINIFI